MKKVLLIGLALSSIISCGPVIKPTKAPAAEIKLDVPFEPNYGNTCFVSSFAMVMHYWGKKVSVKDLRKVVGNPPFQTYSHPELNRWMKRNHNLSFRYFTDSNIEDLKIYLNEGYPVIVHQDFSLGKRTGHNRVVIGYSDPESVFITNDPSNLGPNYKISYEDFKKLWKASEPGPRNKGYLVMPVAE
jgi:ABC-type bacteriocin/lantibiotic exporter with double-glycine peptidase domain